MARSPGLGAQRKCRSLGRKELSLESSFLYVLMLSSTHRETVPRDVQKWSLSRRPWQAWRCSTYHVMCVHAHTCRLMAVRGHCPAEPSGSVADAAAWLPRHRSLAIWRSAALVVLRMHLLDATARKLTACDRLPRRCLRTTPPRCALWAMAGHRDKRALEPSGRRADCTDYGPYHSVPVVRGHSPCLSSPATFGWSSLDPLAGQPDVRR